MIEKWRVDEKNKCLVFYIYTTSKSYIDKATVYKGG